MMYMKSIKDGHLRRNDMGLKCDKGVNEHLHLGNKKTVIEALRWIRGLEVTK
jgi:hypothetical protein